MKFTLLFFLLVTITCAQEGIKDPFKADDRYKTDLLLIVAHPDDETAIGSFLAKSIYDDKKKIAIIYTNRGEGGGNSYGVEQSTSMGLIREIEVRKAAAKLGIENVWFLDGRDTPGQDVFASLRQLNHGAALEKIVRIIRLTRPEIILTWLPHFVAGENHGDHQASGVVATEAFDLAGNPAVFPTQVAFPREFYDINNIGEGLNPWQPKKIYYFSDREKELSAPGPAFDLSGISSEKKIPYSKLAAELHTSHLTQGDVAERASEAIKNDNYEDFHNWLKKFHLIFGKSLVGGNPEDDVFANITNEGIKYTAPPTHVPEKNTAVTLVPGGAFEYYKEFHRMHGTEHLTQLVEPEIMVTAGSYFHIPLLIKNGSNDTIIVELTSSKPDNWQEYSGSGKYKVLPNSVIPVQTFFGAPSDFKENDIDIITWRAVSNQKTVGEVKMKIEVVEWNLPQ